MSPSRSSSDVDHVVTTACHQDSLHFSNSLPMSISMLVVAGSIPGRAVSSGRAVGNSSSESGEGICSRILLRSSSESGVPGPNACRIGFELHALLPNPTLVPRDRRSRCEPDGSCMFASVVSPSSETVGEGYEAEAGDDIDVGPEYDGSSSDDVAGEGSCSVVNWGTATSDRSDGPASGEFGAGVAARDASCDVSRFWLARTHLRFDPR